LLDLTLMQVARRIGVSETTLHRYERGASKPRTKAIETAWSLALFREVK
jgi:transcriptional regulator with XRE-family HTH domain